MSFFKLDTKAMRRVLDDLREVAKRPYRGARGRRQIKAIRRVLSQEARQGAGFSPSGATFGFKAVRPFGTRPATSPPLGGPGSSYWRSWLGGPGSVTQIRGKGVVVASSLPYAIVHRGGVTAGSPRVTEIRPKKIGRDGRTARFHKLRGLFGVFVRDDTVIRVPSRPHADPRAPQYQAAVADEFDLQLTEAAS